MTFQTLQPFDRHEDLGLVARNPNVVILSYDVEMTSPRPYREQVRNHQTYRHATPLLTLRTQLPKYGYMESLAQCQITCMSHNCDTVNQNHIFID